MRAHASTTPRNRLKKHWKRTKAADVHYFFLVSWRVLLPGFVLFFSLTAVRAHASMTSRNTLQKHRKWTKTTDNHFFFCSLGHASCCCLTSFVLFFFFSQGHASIWALDTTQHTVKAPEINVNNRSLLYFVFCIAR
ncbi:hypothetical protein BC940DRAFT_77784 [Gongronella butleri]|nr:hypothetical protein BC940DRAFT_77784 [Gongronella butleri]